MPYAKNTWVVIITILFLNLIIIFAKESVYEPLKNNDTMAKFVLNTLEDCFEHKLDMVTIAGDFKNFENWHKNFPPKLLIYRVGLSEWKEFEHHKRLQNAFALTENYISKLKYPSKLFLVSSSSPVDLKQLLRRMKMYLTWNSSGSFLFVNEELESCNQVDSVLREAWKFNIYNAAYICFDEWSNIQFFSFNPFKKASSKTWKFSHFTNGINQNISWPMAIFKFIHNSSSIDGSTCPDPNFDKTRDLNNYPVNVRSVVVPVLFELKPGLEKLKTRLTLSSFKGSDSGLSQILWSHLRGQPVISLANNMGYIDKNNIPRGLLRDLFRYELDMSPNKRYIDDFWKLQTFPRDIHGICLMTLIRSGKHVFPLVVLFDMHIIWSILLLACAATPTLVYVLKMDSNKVYLEILQRLLSMSTTFQPEKTFFKRFIFIYIGFTFFNYNLELNSSIMYRWYGDTNEKMPQSLEGFYEAQYDLVGHGRYRQFLDNRLAQRYIVTNFPTYSETLFHFGNGKTACFCDCKIAAYDITKYPESVRISEPVLETFVTYLVREDWPLLSTVNDIIHRLVQAGIPVFLDSITFDNFNKMKRDKKEAFRKHEELVQPLALEGVYLIFYCFAAGQLFAFIIFLLELCRSKCRLCKVELHSISKKSVKIIVVRNNRAVMQV